MEFLSEDLYGGQQVSIQDAVDAINRFDINSIQNLQQDLDQLQFLNPGLFQSPASSIDFGMLTSGLPITPEAILGEQASRGLMDTLQTLSSPEFQAFYDDLIASDVITDPEQIQDILDPPQFAVGPGFDDQNAFKEVVLGDPGQIDEDTTQSPVETIFNEDGTITTIIDPTLITLPPLVGDPEVEGDGGGGSAAPGEGEEETEEADTVIPDYSDIVNPEFEVPDAPIGETGIPDFYEVDEEGNVTVILDPDNPIIVPPDRVPGHVDTTTPGTYPESGVVSDEQEETVTPAPSGPNIVLTPSLPSGGSVSGGGAGGSDQITTGGSGGGIGTGIGTGSGNGTGDGDGSGDGMLTKDTKKAEQFMAGTGYERVAVPGLILPQYAQRPVSAFGALNGLLTRLS